MLIDFCQGLCASVCAFVCVCVLLSCNVQKANLLVCVRETVSVCVCLGKIPKQIQMRKRGNSVNTLEQSHESCLPLLHVCVIRASEHFAH